MTPEQISIIDEILRLKEQLDNVMNRAISAKLKCQYTLEPPVRMNDPITLKITYTIG